MANAALSNRERKQQRKQVLAAPRYPKADEAQKVVKVAAVKAPRETVDGLLRLLKRNKITPAQFTEGMAYRAAHRDAGDTLSMKSCIDVSGVTVAPGPGSYDRAMVSLTSAKRELFTARFVVLRGQVDMLTVMDGICGLGWTSMDLAGDDQHKARVLEALLRVALDLLLAHREALKTGA